MVIRTSQVQTPAPFELFLAVLVAFLGPFVGVSTFSASSWSGFGLDANLLERLISKV